MKAKKGITLISLIITIIIMVILAGITLSAVVSDNGIIAKGNAAKAILEEKEIGEIIQTSYYYDEQNPGALEYENTKSSIELNLAKVGYEGDSVKFIETEKNGTKTFPLKIKVVGKTGEYEYEVTSIEVEPELIIPGDLKDTIKLMLNNACGIIVTTGENDGYRMYHKDINTANEVEKGYIIESGYKAYIVETKSEPISDASKQVLSNLIKDDFGFLNEVTSIYSKYNYSVDSETYVAIVYSMLSQYIVNGNEGTLTSEDEQAVLRNLETIVVMLDGVFEPYIGYKIDF